MGACQLRTQLQRCVTARRRLRAHAQVIAALLKRPLPTAGLPEDPADHEKAPWWKLRKWVLRVAFRLFERYGDPKIAKVESSRAFASLFLQEHSIEYLKVRRQASGRARAVPDLPHPPLEL